MAEGQGSAQLRISIVKDWTPQTHGERNQEKAMRAGVWKAPTYIGFQAPVPKAPDYSTPAKVNARIWEFCGHPFIHKAMSDKSFGKAMKAFRAAVPRMACAVEDHHVSKWEVVVGCTLKGTEDHECKRARHYRNADYTCVEGYVLRAKKQTDEGEAA